MAYKDKEKQKEYNAKYRVANKEKIKERMVKYRATHKEELKKYDTKYSAEHKQEKRIYYYTNKAKITERNKKYCISRKKGLKEYRAKYWEKYYREHKEEIKERLAKYYSTHKIKIHVNEYLKKRRLATPLFKMKSNLRGRTREVFKRIGLNKPAKTETLLGADYKTVMLYIESQFIFGMTWENYGKWHIDHKKPLAKAKTEKQLIKLCHYKNLQPLWAEENLSKQHKTDFVVKEVRFG